MKWIRTKYGLPESNGLEDIDFCQAQKYLVYNNRFGVSIALFLDGEWWKDYQSKIVGGEIVYWSIIEEPK